MSLQAGNATQRLQAGPAMAESRVAILAFELLGLDKQTQTVMAGLQDALMADLANLSGIRLVPGQNLSALGLQGAPASQIAQVLKVDQLIRGSVQQFGEQLRVNLQIVDAERGEATWGQAIQGARSDLFAVQANIAQSLADALGTPLAASHNQAVNNQAYEAYLAALSMWKLGHGKEEDLSALLDKALALQPNFIDAHLLALLKAARDYWFSTNTRAESEQAISRHLTALESQNTPPVKLAAARAVRRYYLDHDPRGGVEIMAPFRRQLTRNSESALFYAYMLRRIGRSDEAFEILDQVMEQDPSLMVPLETKAELLAFQGRGGAAMELLMQSVERFEGNSKTKLKLASFAYQLTGELGFIRVGREAMENDEMYKGLLKFADLEIARRKGDLQTIRELARKFDGDDKTISGHGRVPKELGVALALRAGQAPQQEVEALAQTALQKLQNWRQESDSDARRSTMALVLALLGRGDEAIALSLPVEQAYPLERDQLEAGDRILEASTIYALLGRETEVLQRLQKLSKSQFFAMNLCAIPHSIDHQAIWQMDVARGFIKEQCEPLWQRNRQDMLPVLERL